MAEPNPTLEDENTILPGEESPVDDASSSTTISDDSTKIIEELRASLARSQADYQNLVMRNERDRAEMLGFLSAKILLPLLSQVDNLERAVKLKEGIEGDGFVDGVRSVLSSMQKYLESQGVTPFDSLGQHVDPDKHDVMSQMAGEEGVVLQEFERGYMMGERVLRHAKVIVGSGN